LFTRALEQLAVPTALSANTVAIVKASLSMNLLYVGKLADLSPGFIFSKFLSFLLDDCFPLLNHRINFFG